MWQEGPAGRTQGWRSCWKVGARLLWTGWVLSRVPRHEKSPAAQPGLGDSALGLRPILCTGPSALTRSPDAEPSGADTRSQHGRSSDRPPWHACRMPHPRVRVTPTLEACARRAAGHRNT